MSVVKEMSNNLYLYNYLSAVLKIIRGWWSGTRPESKTKNRGIASESERKHVFVCSALSTSLNP